MELSAPSGTHGIRRTVLALAVAAMGVVDLLSAALSHPPDRLRALQHLVPTSVLDTSRTFTFLAGATLLVAAWGLRRIRRGASTPRVPASPRRSWPARAGLVGIALVAWLAGGGAWLVRNEVRFGSPVAPSGLRVMGVTIFAGETLAESAHYYSVAGDVAATPGYPLGRKVAFFVRRWIGTVAQPTAALLLLLVADLGVRRWRRAHRATDAAGADTGDPRLALLVAGTIVAAAFLWLIYKATWS